MNTTLKLLNRICPFYHTGFGFRTYISTVPIQLPRDFYWYIRHNASIYDENEQPLRKYPPDGEFVNFRAIMPACVCRNLSKHTFKHDKIVIMYRNEAWDFGLPTLWYNSPPPERFKKSKQWLDNLSSRPYITVDKHAVRVTISANKKGSPITIEDVLFATRALALDGFRSYDYFEKIKSHFVCTSSKKIRTLYLEPHMDNFST